MASSDIDLSHLSDQELYQELVSHGLDKAAAWQMSSSYVDPTHQRVKNYLYQQMGNTTPSTTNKFPLNNLSSINNAINDYQGNQAAQAQNQATAQAAQAAQQKLIDDHWAQVVKDHPSMANGPIPSGVTGSMEQGMSSDDLYAVNIASLKRNIARGMDTNGSLQSTLNGLSQTLPNYSQISQKADNLIKNPPPGPASLQDNPMMTNAPGQGNGYIVSGKTTLQAIQDAQNPNLYPLNFGITPSYTPNFQTPTVPNGGPIHPSWAVGGTPVTGNAPNTGGGLWAGVNASFAPQQNGAVNLLPPNAPNIATGQQ